MTNQVSVPEDEYESVRVIGSRVAKQNEAVLKSIQALIDTGNVTQEGIQALIPVLQSIADMKHEIIVQPAGVTVESAKVVMPEIPAPVVKVMEAEEQPVSYRFTFERDGRGFITGGRIYPE